MQVEVRGSPIHYEEAGEGRPVLMLHGMPGDHRIMTHFLEPIFAERSGWRRLYPDLPGMGATPAADWVHTQDDMLDAALGFLEAVAPGQRFLLIGVSYGGFLALGALHRCAEVVDGVMLWTPALSLDEDRPVPDHRVFVEDAAVIASLEADEQMWRRVAVLQTSDTIAHFRTAVKPGLLAADRPFLERLSESFTFPLTPLPAAVEVPSLILAGHQDSLVGFADTVGLLPSFPRGTLAVLDRAGHGIAGEQPTLFRELVTEWLNRVEA